MPAIASAGILPGGRLRRLVAGVPRPPEVGALAEVEIAVSGIGLPINRLTLPDARLVPLLTDLPVTSPLAPFDAAVRPVAIGTLDCTCIVVPAEAFLTVGTAGTRFESSGTVFATGRKIGRPPAAHDSRTSTATRSAEGLLARLLPILLPPVRTELGEESLTFPHPLYAFQGEGVRWLIEHEPGALLADDMGLGKTVQAIVALRRLFREGGITSALVVSPKAVVTSWRRHLQEWAPELETIEVGGSPADRAAQWTAVAQHRAHVVVTNYDSAVNDMDRVASIAFGVLVIDEMQNLKNGATKRHRELARVTTSRRWGLTGTPLENRVDELAIILRFLNPRLLRSNTPTIEETKRAAEAIMLRRRKEQVLTDLPELQAAAVYVSLGSRQQAAYDRAEREGVAELRSGVVALTNVLSLITRLKQICNGIPGENAKAEWLADYIEAAVDEGDRVLVFSQFVETLDALQSELRAYKPQMYTGAMSDRARQQAVDQFQLGTHSVLLMSLKAGGVGLTLTKANHVVHFDSWWNPATMSQATARAHRIGQEKAVFERTLVVTGTIEERIQTILGAKRDLFRDVVDDLSTTGLARALTEREIFGLFNLEPPERQRVRGTS